MLATSLCGLDVDVACYDIAHELGARDYGHSVSGEFMADDVSEDRVTERASDHDSVLGATRDIAHHDPAGVSKRRYAATVTVITDL